MSEAERHKRIWLQHPDDADPSVGRLWCQDKVWPNDSGEHEPTEYVRADLYAQLERERDAAREALRRIAGISNECTWHKGTRKLAADLQDIIRAALAATAQGGE